MMYIPRKDEKERAKIWLADPKQCPSELVFPKNLDELAELLVMYERRNG